MLRTSHLVPRRELRDGSTSDVSSAQNASVSWQRNQRFHCSNAAYEPIAKVFRTSKSPRPYLTLLPIGCTSVATTGNRSTERPARRMDDLCRQVSWLMARASCPDLPSIQRGYQWYIRIRLAIHSCGRSHGINAESITPCSLFVILAFARLVTPSRL